MSQVSDLLRAKRELQKDFFVLDAFAQQLKQFCCHVWSAYVERRNFLSEGILKNKKTPEKSKN